MKFNWKTEGTKPTMTVWGWPTSAILLVIVALAWLVTMALTGKVSEQERKYQKAQEDYVNERQQLCKQI